MALSLVAQSARGEAGGEAPGRDRRAEDPRARVLRRTSHEIGSHRFAVAEALEAAALAELKARKPDREVRRTGPAPLSAAA